MTRAFVRRNLTTTAIIIFVVLFCLIQAFKPAFMFNEDGTFKTFGLGCKQKTVIPIWLITFILAILSYLLVLYYLAIPRYRF